MPVEELNPMVELLGGPLDGINNKDHPQDFTKVSYKEKTLVVRNYRYNFYRVTDDKTSMHHRNKYIFIFDEGFHRGLQ
jgi:hypothetical protein